MVAVSDRDELSRLNNEIEAVTAVLVRLKKRRNYFWMKIANKREKAESP